MANIVSPAASFLNRIAADYSQKISAKIRQKPTSLGLLSLRRASAVYVGRRFRSTVGFQAHQSAFTPNNSELMTEESWALQQLKVDIAWNADTLDSFMGKYCPEDSDFESPAFLKAFFTQYIPQKHIYPMLEQALELDMFWRGNRQNPTVNVAGLSINSIDGYQKIIRAAVAATKTNVIATGNPTAGAYYDWARTFTGGLPETIKKLPRKIWAAPENVRGLQNDLLNKNVFNTNFTPAGDVLEQRIPTTNFTLVALPSMAGSNALVLDGSEAGDNMFLLRPKNNSPIIPNLQWESQKRDLWAFGQSQAAFGVESFEDMYVNDVV